MINQSVLSDFGFVVICPRLDVSNLKITMSCLKRNYSDKPVICVISDNVSKDNMKTIKKICSVTRGGNTITSLINKGIKKSLKSWNFVIVAGSLPKINMDKKYSYFLEDEKDVIYPIVDRKYAFPEASINGILIHKKALDDIGEFDENIDSLEKIKVLWALEAKKKGYKLKALLGAKMF